MSEGENREGSEAISQQAPASNPGSDDPSGGIAAGSGGDDTNQVSKSTMDRYAPGETQNTTDETVTDKTNETSKAAADEWAPGEKETTTGGSTTDTGNEESKVAADSWAPGEKETTTGGSTTDTGNEEKKVAGDNWTPDQKEGTSTEGTSNEGTSTSGGDTSTSEAPKKTTGGTAAKENRDAIPTAGGERLGEKHWGESKQVPDNPKPQSEQVSSEEGQPDKATKDNTAQNTGGAAAPSSSADTGGEEKLSMKDKIKDKLNIGSKDK